MTTVDEQYVCYASKTNRSWVRRRTVDGNMHGGPVRHEERAGAALPMYASRDRQQQLRLWANGFATLDPDTDGMPE